MVEYKKVSEALGESVMGLFSLDGYQTGKSIAELGIDMKLSTSMRHNSKKWVAKIRSIWYK